MATVFDRAGVERTLAAIADRLGGDWLVIGGAYVALCLESRRTTEGLDLVAIGHGAERLQLLKIAADLGLPIESVNSAADFFVERVEGWRDEIELLHSGAKGRIFRPTATLFLLLKAPRLTQQDLRDCLAEIQRTREAGLTLDAARVVQALDELPPGDADLEARRALLRSAL